MWHYPPFVPQTAPAPRRDDTGLVWLLTNAASATHLRETVMRSGGDAVRFLRVDACTRGQPVRALLCLELDAMPALRAELQRRLPGCDWHEAPRRGERSHAH